MKPPQGDRLRWAPCGVVADLVHRYGRCLWEHTYGDPPWHGERLTDLELADRLCAGCEVQDACLELEFRTAGEHTVGVWGALPEGDRRALYREWRRLREIAELADTDGGRP